VGRALPFLLSLSLLLPAAGSGAEPVVQPVAALYDDLAEINGVKPTAASSPALPILCFEFDEASLPNPRKGRDRATRAELATRRTAIEDAISRLARDLVSAYRASGSPTAPIVVQVIGHADSATAEGKPDYNARLSYARALTIANLLRTDVASFGGGLRWRLTLEVEGRSTFEPWPNRVDHCGSVPKNSAVEAAAALPSPIPADRRVEIEILTGALTSAGPETVGSEKEKDRRLRAYPLGTMPWRPAGVPLLEPPEHGAAKIDHECFDGANVPPGTSWLPLSESSLIDYGDGSMAVRFAVTPVYAPTLKGLRVELQLARGENDAGFGVGVPGYWSVHERLPRFLENLQTTHPELNDTLLRLAKCIVPPGEAVDAGYFSRGSRPIDYTKAALGRLPKDINGIMAAAEGLHQNLRFIDLKPGMKVQFKGSLADPYAQRLQPVGDGFLQFISDPLDPCRPDPAPRKSDNPFQSKIADPFLAWMSHSVFWSSCGSAEAASASAAVTAAAVANVDDKPEHFLISGFSQLELLLSWGSTRLFLPRDEHPHPQAKAVETLQAGSWGTILVASPDKALIDELTQNAAAEASFKSTQFNMYNKCINLGSGNPVHCGFMFSQETFSPLASFGVNGKMIEKQVGTRVVHLAPASVYDHCFPVDSSGKWLDGALLAQPITWKAQLLPESALTDRRDCRLLGLPMVDGSSVSW